MVNNSKKQTLIALKKAQTNINNVIKMIEQDKYCIHILQQILAVNGLLKSASNKILENHLNTCFSNGMQTTNENAKQNLIKEVLEVLKMGGKKK